MWQIIAPLVFLYFLTIIIWSCQTFDNLVRLEYNNYRNIWERDGRPTGYFWRAPENQKLRISSDREWLQWTYKQSTDKWLLSTPKWIRDDPEAFRLVRRYRSLTFLLFVSLIVLIIAMVTATGL